MTKSKIWFCRSKLRLSVLLWISFWASWCANCKLLAVGRQWLIPVCFDADLAPDLAEVAATKGLSPDDVIALMTGANFQVYMVGFMPGFPYMGGLPGVLEMPRLASPRTAVPARSLGITGAMCAVYPWESPGGWRLIGRTPVPFFSMRESGSPSLLVSGDRVRWRAIGRSEFDALEEAGRRVLRHVSADPFFSRNPPGDAFHIVTDKQC